MLYAVLCYHNEAVTEAWSKAEDDAVMARLAAVQEPLARQGKIEIGRASWRERVL